MLQDSFFMEDCPYLLTTCRVRYPDTREQLIVRPLEIPVAELGPGSGAVVIQGLCRGGQTYKVELHGNEEPLSLAASLFYLPQDGLMIGTPPGKEPLINPALLRFRQTEKGSVLYLSLFGSEGRAAGTKDAEETFSFYLGSSEELPTVLPALPRFVMAELPRHGVRWS